MILALLMTKGCTSPHILAGKIMRKCRENEVPTTIVSLAAQCSLRVQFNQVAYLCKDFQEEYKEAQEEGKTFHYVWLIIIIMITTWRKWKGSQFPPIEPDVCEAVNYASLWYTKDPLHALENGIFFLLLSMYLHMMVNQKPRFSPNLYRK